MTKEYDVAVLGGGIGGYTAAIRAAQLGMTVAVVERDKLGGTCLHRGCIPTKALLRSAEVWNLVNNADNYGVDVPQAVLNYGRAAERSRQIVAQMYQGVQMLMAKNKIEVYAGTGRIIGPSIFSPRSGALAVELAEGEMVTLVPKHLIIATGSRPRQLPGLEPDGEFILTSDDMLRLASLPDSLLIVGGGAIGVEWASMMNDFGVKVTLIEQSSRLLPAEDDEIADALRTRLEARGIRVLTGAHVRTDTFGLDNGQLFIHVDQGEQTERLSAEKMLIAVGRQANIEDIGLENTDIRLEHGVIRVNSAQQTSEPHIYAVGDVTGGVQLAHAAMAEGILAAEHLAGRRVEPLSPHLVPRCVYSRPETASVGWTEREAREKGYDVKVGKFPFRFLGKAVVYGETDGFVKVVADRKTDDILGVHMIGAHVTDYVSEAALAQVLDATPWEVGRTIHPHPSMAESLSEAMLAVDRLSIHI